MSLYQLTVEPGTRFADLYAAGKLAIPEGEMAHALYEITQERTARAGLPAYEISNHAAAGEESRHNLLYWRYGTYAGIGPGAHGRLIVGGSRVATVCERNPEQWVEAVERGGHGFNEMVPLSRAEQADEMLLMGLRLSEGISLERLGAVGGVRPRASVVRALEREGLLEPVGAVDDEYQDDEIRACVGPGPGSASEWSDITQEPHAGMRGRIRASARGRFVLNAVIAELAAAMEPVDPEAASSP
jgi:oxygen-independent coproporphyrinogen-3 oxidase